MCAYVTRHYEERAISHDENQDHFKQDYFVPRSDVLKFTLIQL